MALPKLTNIDLRYAVVLEPDEGAFQVIVPAFPEIHTFGETVEDALAMARDAIELSIAVRRDEGTEIPPRRGQRPPCDGRCEPARRVAGNPT